ncbi:MAG: response regulator [Prochloraceae cyanobacterium]
MNNLPYFLDDQLNNILEKKILIVDDLPDNLSLLSTTLQERGYQVRCAKTGSMALKGVRAYNRDLILLDIKLPDLDGYSICERLKADRLTQHIPIIFLSALDDVFDKVKAFDVGGADYISKPFQIPETLARINHQLALVAAEAKIKQLNSFLERKVQQRTTELQQEIINRIQAEMSAKENLEKLESILNSLVEVVISIDPDTKTIIYLNPAAEAIYDRPLNEFFDRPKLWLEVIHREDRDFVDRSFADLEAKPSINLEYRILRPQGEIRWLFDRRYLVYNNSGKLLRIDGIISDISDK